jgi:hypothetical protein
MSDIFISYKREEQGRARQLAAALEKQGWSVWWDPKLRTGEYFDEVIERALDEARCVIVLWSNSSVRSRYVRDEATYALELGKLAPVAIEEVGLPLRFRGIQTPKLINWDGDESSIDYKHLLDDIAAILSASPSREQYALKHQVEIQGEDDIKRQVEESSAQAGRSEAESAKDPNLAIHAESAKGLPGVDVVSQEPQEAARKQRSINAQYQRKQKENVETSDHSLRWLVVAVAVVGVIIWLLIPQQEDINLSLEEKRQAEFNTLVRAANQAINEGSFEAAKEVLSRLSQLNPNHPALGKLEQRLTEETLQQDTKLNALLQRAEQAIDEGSFEMAKELLTKTAQLDPNNTRIVELQRRLVEAIEKRHLEWNRAKLHEEEITKLLDHGRAAEDAKRLTTPAQDNAVDYYRGVLELDPNNSEAKAGLERVVERYLEWAREAQAAGVESKFEEYLEIAATIDSMHPGIRQLLEEKAKRNRARR